MKTTISILLIAVSVIVHAQPKPKTNLEEAKKSECRSLSSETRDIKFLMFTSGNTLE